MSAYLFIQEGPGSGAVHPLGTEVVVVGRGDDCGIQLQDGFVSRRHFQIEPGDGGYYLVDLGSRNTTILNGATQRERTRLRHGAEICVGSTKLRFSSGAPDAAAGDLRQLETAGYTPAESLSAGVASEILGESQETRKLREFVERVAGFDVTVLVTGESGTGKEVVARAIHARSTRIKHPLVTVNCAAIPRELVESELFGHEKGAFTGALSQYHGKFEQAHGGTLFLDEIGELPLDGQAKLLRVLEERKITRLGSGREIAIDVRIIAATNRDLREAAREGRFRVDLLYRLEVAHVHVAPLRHRRDDIEPLARHFLALSERTRGRGPLAFSESALAKLCAHDWPGNVRELRNVVERASIFSSERVLDPGSIELRAGVGAPTPEPQDRQDRPAAPMKEVIQAEVERALAATGGNRKKAAELLGISRSSLYNYMDRFKLR